MVAAVEPRDPEQLQHMLRGQHARDGLSGLEADLLYRAFRGELSSEKLSNPEQVAYARLLNAGLVGGDSQLASNVAASLAETGT